MTWNTFLLTWGWHLWLPLTLCLIKMLNVKTNARERRLDCWSRSGNSGDLAMVSLLLITSYLVDNFQLISHDADDNDNNNPWGFVDNFDLINHGDIEDHRSERGQSQLIRMATFKNWFQRNFSKRDYFWKNYVYFSFTQPKLSLAKLKIRRKLLTMTLQTIVFIFSWVSNAISYLNKVVDKSLMKQDKNLKRIIFCQIFFSFPTA